MSTRWASCVAKAANAVALITLIRQLWSLTAQVAEAIKDVVTGAGVAAPTHLAQRAKAEAGEAIGVD